MSKLMCLWVLLLTSAIISAQNQTKGVSKPKSVYVDKKGILRWTDGTELALFGANYSLPSSCDYRAAGRITTDRKSIIDQDFAHFARMGWDGMRLCLWGDYENSDKDGNLVVNDHLDLMDYAIYKARERGIYILFTPITTYSSLWPDAMNDHEAAKGFSSFYKKGELGTNPEAIKVQVNYLKQMLNHVNPYTNTALKDDPQIVLIELINEPDHHSNDFEGSVKYINTLVEAIKSTGYNKPLFHNYTQDLKMDKAIAASKVDGAAIGWYPMGLVSGHRLTDNNLRTVDEYTPMKNKVLAAKPRIVYEFDEADSYTPYMYPAMTRAYREVGVQFVAMFSYDMIATAPYNLGWQTHIMNPVYYPQKGVAAIISAELMKQLPLYKTYGPYPDNTRFGPARISYEENLSELNTAQKFMYANNTSTQPANLQTLSQIVGYGSSPVATYSGKGIYYLDKLNPGTWRLEVYPDALLVNDPFEPMSPDKIVSRLIYREQTMTLTLPDLGKTFKVTGLNSGNSYNTETSNASFTIKPGVYLVSTKPAEIAKLPAKLGYLNFTEFVCPGPTDAATFVKNNSFDSYTEEHPIDISAQIVNNTKPDEVNLYYRELRYGKWFIKVPMSSTDGYNYSATIPADKVKEGFYKYVITVTYGNKQVTYPAGIQKMPWDWDFYTSEQWQFSVVKRDAVLPLLHPVDDCSYLSFSRIGDAGRSGLFNIIPQANGIADAVRIFYPVKLDSPHNDYTMSLSVKNRVLSRISEMEHATGIEVMSRGQLKNIEVFVSFMEVDGTTWTKTLTVNEQWERVFIPFTGLTVGKGVMLPQGYPVDWNYWITPAKGRGVAGDKINPNKIERLQISLRPVGDSKPGNGSWIDISEVNIRFE